MHRPPGVRYIKLHQPYRLIATLKRPSPVLAPWVIAQLICNVVSNRARAIRKPGPLTVDERTPSLRSFTIQRFEAGDEARTAPKFDWSIIE